MFRYFTMKVIIAGVASLLLSIFLAIISNEPTDYESNWVDAMVSFNGMVMIYLLFAFPVMLVAGIPVSILIDKCIPATHSILTFIVKSVLYAIAGAILFLLFLLYFKFFRYNYYGIEQLLILLIGSLGALLFFWLERISYKLFFRRS